MSSADGRRAQRRTLMVQERKLEVCVAKNTGHGSRTGAVRDRFQLFDFATGLFVVFCTSTGKLLRVKKSPGPAKGISVRLPKRYR